MRAAVRGLSLLFIFTVPWEGMIRISGLGTATRLLGLVLAMAWVGAVLVTGKVRRPTFFHVGLGVFVLWVAMSVLWSADPARSLDQVETWIQLLGLSLILWDLFNTREAVLTALQAYVLGAYVAFLAAGWNFLFGEPYYDFFERFSPTGAHPNGFGIVMALGVPVAWYLAGQRETKISRSPGLNRILKVVNYGYIPVAFLGITLSGTRTAAIAAVLGVAYGLAQFTRLRPREQVAALLGLTLIFVVLVPMVTPLRSFQRFGTTANEITQGTLNGRLDQWQEGLAAFSERPVVGYGVNMYRSVNVLGKVAHNSYLSVLVQLGLVGFVLFLVPALTAVKAMLSHPRWERRFWLSLVGAWAIGASALTWEHRKPTWLFFTLAVTSAATFARLPPAEPQPASTPEQVVGVR